MKPLRNHFKAGFVVFLCGMRAYAADPVPNSPVPNSDVTNASAQLAPLAPDDESHPGLGVESMYAEAVLAFNKKQTKQALHVLDDLLKRDPRHVQALELKALTLKSEGDDANSLEVYQRLIRLKPAKERGPYHFELGVIYHRQKRTEFARVHFERALKLKFNEVPSHLFLGLIAFNSELYPAAEEHFTEVVRGPIPDLKVVAHYYLGMINFKIGYGAGGTHELMKARAVASEMPDNVMARDISEATDKILAPFNSAQWFGSLSAQGQYDSNISQIPTGLASSTPASGKSTPKTVLSGGFGRMGSPLRTFQWVASYRFSYNRNFNSNVRNYEFFANMPSFYLNYHPLDQVTGGFKVDGNLVFQNLPKEDGSAGYIFSKYSFGAELGPFIRRHFSRALQLEGSLYVRPSQNYTETGLSGTAFGAKVSAHGDAGNDWLVPGVSVGYELNNAQGNDYRNRTLAVGLSNTAKLGADSALSTSLDFTASKYPLEASGRSDKNLNLRASYMYFIGTKWSVSTDLNYTKNISSLPDSYSYYRWTAGAGVNWSL